MATIPKVLIKRTDTPNKPPTGLQEGELAVEMANPVRLWVGVPTSIDPTGKKLLVDTETAGGALVSDTPPANMTQGDFWWEADTGILWMNYIDANTTQFVQVNGIPIGVYLKLSGGTLFGNIAVSKSNPTITLNKLATGERCSINANLNDLKRWTLDLGDATLESGTGNAGSDYVLTRFDDAGVSLGVGMKVERGTGNLTITGEGFKAVAGPWAAASDERIKTVQGNYLHGLKEIKQLQPVRYTFNGNDSVLAIEGNDHADVVGKEFVGLVAQDAEIPMPELVKPVTGWIDGEQVDDYRIFDPNALTYALINAVKQLSEQVDDLRAEIAELKDASNGN